METTNTTPAQQEDKTVAIISYITLIGFIIAIILHGSNKTKLGSYHLKQSLGLIAFAVASMIATFIIGLIPFVNFLLLIIMPVLWIGILVLLIMGIVNAASGQEKPVPIIGGMSEKLFAGAFN